MCLRVPSAADGVIPGTGHFHVNIDAPNVEEGESIPFDDTHKHYGKGQTEVDLELEKVRGHECHGVCICMQGT